MVLARFTSALIDREGDWGEDESLNEIETESSAWRRRLGGILLASLELDFLQLSVGDFVSDAAVKCTL